MKFKIGAFGWQDWESCSWILIAARDALRDSEIAETERLAPLFASSGSAKLGTLMSCFSKDGGREKISPIPGLAAPASLWLALADVRSFKRE